MSEDKKEGFTLSDKIKTSKPVFNPFSKRASSKVGANGKPKKTLFERTRRDAPFFIAALLALLLLPFLYKYSGTVDEPMFIAPCMGDEEECGIGSAYGQRFDYDPGVSGDEILQMSGRDPMELIKGWRKDGEAVASLHRDDIDDDYPGSASTYKDTKITNYQRRKAPAATRAAFNRTPTKINELRGASLNARGGGGLGSRFGGANLKAAAKRDSSGGPKRGIKPVSLQPLRAAGSPSRSYFGQGGAFQARASRDALGKADAVQALKDAAFNPVENQRLGGLGSGLFATGGGAGKFDRNMNFKGITPWWWDLMKQREQEKWRWKYFLWRKPLADAIATIIGNFATGLSNLINCLVWGNADGDMDYFLGGAPGEIKEGQCNGVKTSEWDARVAQAKADHENFPFGSFPSSEDNCRRAFGLAANVKVKYEKGSSVVGGKGPWGARKSCLGGFTKDRTPNAEDRYRCESISNDHLFEVRGTGKAANWRHTYHAVIVKNDVIKDKANNGKALCGARTFRDRTPTVTGVGESVVRTTGQHVDTDNGKEHSHNFHAAPGTSEYGERSGYDGCVIYVSKGGVFDYVKYKREVEKALDNGGWDISAFQYIRPIRIEGYVMEKPLTTAVNGNLNTGLPAMRNMPMRYIEFYNDYVKNWTGIFHSQAERNGKRVGGGLAMMSCNWNAFNIVAHAINGLEKRTVAGTLTYEASRYQLGDLCVDADVTDVGSGISVGQEKRVKDVVFNEKRPGSATYYLSEDTVEVMRNYIANQTSTSTAIDVTLDVKWTAYECKDASVNASDSAQYSTDVAAQQIDDTEDECKSGDTQSSVDTNNCEWVKQCEQKDGKWVWGTPQKKDPNCGSNDITVINGFPSSDCAGVKSISNKQLVAVDADIMNLLNKAKQIYERQHPNTQVDLKDCITIDTLLSAIDIVGQQDNIPLNAVCMLGKTIGANSQDPHVSVLGYNNMLGTFVAYMGETSAYFPTEWIVSADGQKKELDPRFYWCERSHALQAMQQGDHPTFHYGRYVPGKKSEIGAGYKNSLNTGIWKGAPLQPIAAAVFTPNPKAGTDANRKAYHNAYANVLGSGSCNLNGTMSYQQVQSYLNAICSQGSLQQKPSNGTNCQGKIVVGTGSGALGNNQGPTNDCGGTGC